MRSFLRKPSNRRSMYLNLAGSVEGQLREAYAERYAAGLDTQVTLADKLDVGRSVINKRLRGLMNMTLETVSDMAWALGYSVIIQIFDPNRSPTNAPYVRSEHAGPPVAVVGSNILQTSISYQTF
jgi:hypothetical protein